MFFRRRGTEAKEAEEREEEKLREVKPILILGIYSMCNGELIVSRKWIRRTSPPTTLSHIYFLPSSNSPICMALFGSGGSCNLTFLPHESLNLKCWIELRRTSSDPPN